MPEVQQSFQAFGRDAVWSTLRSGCQADHAARQRFASNGT